MATAAQVVETKLGENPSSLPPDLVSPPFDLHPAPTVPAPPSVPEDNTRDAEGTTSPFPRILLVSETEVERLELGAEPIAPAAPHAVALAPARAGVVDDPEVAGIPASNRRERRSRWQIM